MGFKVRGYTRDVPQEKVRDYSLFAIATEGTERERDYFRLFDGIDRIKVDIIEPETSDDEGMSEKKESLFTLESSGESEGVYQQESVECRGRRLALVRH